MELVACHKTGAHLLACLPPHCISGLQQPRGPLWPRSEGRQSVVPTTSRSGSSRCGSSLTVSQACPSARRWGPAPQFHAGLTKSLRRVSAGLPGSERPIRCVKDAIYMPPETLQKLQTFFQQNLNPRMRAEWGSPGNTSAATCAVPLGCTMDWPKALKHCCYCLLVCCLVALLRRIARQHCPAAAPDTQIGGLPWPSKRTRITQGQALSSRLWMAGWKGGNATAVVLGSNLERGDEEVTTLLVHLSRGRRSPPR